MNHLSESHIVFLQDVLSPLVVENLERLESIQGLTDAYTPQFREVIRELLSEQEAEWGIHTLFSRPDLFKRPPETDMAMLIICLFDAIGKGTPASLHPALLSDEGFSLMTGLAVPFFTNTLLSSSWFSVESFSKEWGLLVNAGILEMIADGFIAKDVLDDMAVVCHGRYMNVLPF